MRPETMRRLIRLHDANFPPARKLAPHLVRHTGSNSTPPIAAHNKELRHVPGGRVAGQFRPLLYENQPRQFAIHSDKKRMPASLAPIQGKMLVAESTVLPQLNFVKLAEVVRV